MINRTAPREKAEMKKPRIQQGIRGFLLLVKRKPVLKSAGAAARTNSMETTSL
jgi:hypothetical protein